MALKKLDSFFIPKYEIVIGTKDGKKFTEKQVFLDKNLKTSTFDFYTSGNIHVIDYQTNEAKERNVYILNETGLKHLGSFNNKPIYINIAKNSIQIFVQEFYQGSDSVSITEFDFNGNKKMVSEPLPYSIATFVYDYENDKIIYAADKISIENSEGVVLGEYVNGKWVNHEKTIYDQVSSMELISNRLYVAGFIGEKVSMSTYDLSFKKLKDSEVPYRVIKGKNADGELIVQGDLLKNISIYNIETNKITKSAVVDLKYLSTISPDYENNILYAFGGDGYRIFNLSDFNLLQSINYTDISKIHLHLI